MRESSGDEIRLQASTVFVLDVYLSCFKTFTADKRVGHVDSGIYSFPTAVLLALHCARRFTRFFLSLSLLPVRLIGNMVIVSEEVHYPKTADNKGICAAKVSIDARGGKGDETGICISGA